MKEHLLSELLKLTYQPSDLRSSLKAYRRHWHARPPMPLEVRASLLKASKLMLEKAQTNSDLIWTRTDMRGELHKHKRSQNQVQYIKYISVYLLITTWAVRTWHIDCRHQWETLARAANTQEDLFESFFLWEECKSI